MTAYFVSPGGDDSQSGTADEPFRTVARGITALSAAGDVLHLRPGHYVEAVTVDGKQGTASRPIVVRGPRATLDGCLPQFLRAGNDAWEPGTGPGAHADEYVSREAIAFSDREDAIFRGAFAARQPYTRLITYSTLDDLRAENETWDLEAPLDDPRPGWEVVDDDGIGKDHKRPWVYMGPGFFVERLPGTSTARIRIRLSHTHNGVAGLADYHGETDPRRLALAICQGNTTTLVVRNSRFVRFERLSIRFGGATSVKVERSRGVTFDHVRIMASAQGVNLTGTRRSVLRHCEIRGGIPSWFFRSDRKNGYKFKEGGAILENDLGARTSRVLLDGTMNDDLEIHHCELADGHDLVLPGVFVRFHHNWVHNLNDESLIVDEPGTGDLRIHQNVFTQCLSGISFALNSDPGTHRWVYRNLFDLRSPTASRRPAVISPEPPLRFGHLYKGGGEDGPLDFFQNTCLVRTVDRDASYTHYQNDIGSHPRRSFNNIFIAVNPDEAFNRPIAIVPGPDFPGPTDGNCYFRVGNVGRELLLLLSPRTFFPDLCAYRDSTFFEESRDQYGPGFEAHSIEADPRFRRIAPDGTPRGDDDFRLLPDSPAREGGVELHEKIKPLDPFAPESGCPDIGCFPFGAQPLRVGVDGRRRFPPLQPFPPSI